MIRRSIVGSGSLFRVFWLVSTGVVILGCAEAPVPQVVADRGAQDEPTELTQAVNSWCLCLHGKRALQLLLCFQFSIMFVQ